MKKFGCLILLGIIGFLVVELWFYLVVSEWLKAVAPSWVGTGYLEAAIAEILLMFIGWKIARHHGAKIPGAFMAGLLGGSNQAGRHLIGAIGGGLLLIPGFLTDCIGIWLILPPVQKLLGGMAQKVVGAIVRQSLGKMMAGGGMAGFGGMPGGFPPGGLRPDDALRFPGMGPRKPPPKTYDTTAEKDP